jgi:hypothetical protein
LMQITTWQWGIKTISLLIRTSQNGISTKWNQSEKICSWLGKI